MAQDARSTLLQALEQLDAIQSENGEPRRVYLTVAYSAEYENTTYDGLVATSDPSWVTLALLGRAYEQCEAACNPPEDSP